MILIERSDVRVNTAERSDDELLGCGSGRLLIRVVSLLELLLDFSQPLDQVSSQTVWSSQNIRAEARRDFRRERQGWVITFLTEARRLRE